MVEALCCIEIFCISHKFLIVNKIRIESEQNFHAS